MKKNKIVALALSGALLVGATALGTFAYFTDVAQADANLVITTGTLTTTVEKDNEWKVVGDSEITNNTESNNYINVRPGDSFEKTITIKNTGSLQQKLIKEIQGVTEETARYFDVDLSDADKLDGYVLKSGESVDVKIKATLRPELANEYLDINGNELHKNQNHKFNMNDLNKVNGEETPLIKVETTQVNNTKK